jgi:hypothetical protein
VPAQEWVEVWQSFLPALAMPKHFSFSAASAAEVHARETAAASAEATIRLVFMVCSSGGR